MGTSFEVGSFTKDTSGTDNATQSITTSFQPKALRLECAQVTSDQTFTADFVIAIGFSDGTNHRSMWCGSENGVTTMNGNRLMSSTKCLTLVDPNSTAIIAEATVAFNATDFTLTWTENTDTTAFIINWCAIGGSDITDVEVGTFNQPSGTTVTQNVSTGVNTGDFLMLMSHQNSVENSVISTPVPCLGFAESSSGQGAASVIMGGTTTAVNDKIISNAHCLRYLSNSGTLGEAAFSQFTASGFDLDWTNNSGSGRAIYYMEIKGGVWEIGSEQTRTSTGDQTVTTTIKGAGLFLLSANTATINAFDDGARLPTGFSDGTNHKAIWQGGEDNVTTTNNDSYQSASHALVCAAEVGTPSVQDSIDSVEFTSSTVMTLGYDQADATARYFIWVIVEESIDPSSFTPRMVSY